MVNQEILRAVALFQTEKTGFAVGIIIDTLLEQRRQGLFLRFQAAKDIVAVLVPGEIPADQEALTGNLIQGQMDIQCRVGIRIEQQDCLYFAAAD